MARKDAKLAVWDNIHNWPVAKVDTELGPMMMSRCVVTQSQCVLLWQGLIAAEQLFWNTKHFQGNFYKVQAHHATQKFSIFETIEGCCIREQLLSFSCNNLMSQLFTISILLTNFLWAPDQLYVSFFAAAFLFLTTTTDSCASVASVNLDSNWVFLENSKMSIKIRF